MKGLIMSVYIVTLNKLGGRPYRIFIGTRYCSDCGQALDWGEGERKEND